MIYCYDCGTKLEVEDRFCAGCGQALIKEQPTVDYATLEDRSKAHFIDGFIVLLTLFVPLGLGIIPWRYFTLAMIIGHWLYTSIFIGFWGASIGMTSMNLEIVNHDMGRIGCTKALARYLIGILSWVTVMGTLISVTHPRRKTLHDIIFKTLVVRHGS